jgi:hypothetical protein
MAPPPMIGENFLDEPMNNIVGSDPFYIDLIPILAPPIQDAITKTIDITTEPTTS